ncbi:beta-catenin-like protein 1 [Chrysoperla carnea]|uniref:beta-catenin-like protein 1 n=1 Tax=Chrysoperla carnea TaxID=189513 RepID=UPI001D071B78|nr:beta-catenin-like protein 1 [Chrysoperla carnea]
MDIGELLSYKPPQALKRPTEPENDPDSDDEMERQKKIRRMAQAKAHQIAKQARASSKNVLEAPEIELSEKEKAEILKYVETEETEGEVLDESAIKRLVLVFEKRCLRNREMRIKFPENPEKFMESEVELHQIIQDLHSIATVPDLYPLFIELQAIPSLLELLSHENTDIACAVIDLLQELTDADILNESPEGANALLDVLLAQHICALLVQNMERLDEAVQEEATGVHQTLNIFENLIETQPNIAIDATKQGLMQWLLQRLRKRGTFDPNKLYASELLSILLQDTTAENRVTLGELDGIDVLLQQLAFYKRHDPQSAEEQEMMENLFNCLCSCLLEVSNRDRFLKGEGLQLMNLMLREKKMSRNGSLKVLDYAMSGPNGKDNCNKFVDILGLRTIFPLFMKTPIKNRKKLLSAEQHEEHVVSIISSMLRNCRGSQRQRLISKFTENDHEKVDRLLELHFKYLEKVEEIDNQIEQEKQKKEQDGENDSDEDDDEANYLKRLENGLFTLQLVDYIILEVSCGGPPSIKQRVSQILNLRAASLKTIRHVMREYAGNLGDAGDSEWRDQEQQHILQLVDKF